MDEDAEIRERIFHNVVRQQIVELLLFVLLYTVSYIILCTFKRQPDHDEFYAVDAEDAVVYRVSLWICTFAMSVSLGAVLLLPMSIIANEALLMFPNSYYLQWINSSLIYGLWNSIFLCSNVSLFILLPFAYLFTESEGLPGSKKGIMSRVYETLAVLVLLTILIYGLARLVSFMVDDDKDSRKVLVGIWNFSLSYLYSCISLLGVLMLLVCTPVGFALLFTVMGDLVFKPKFLQDVEGELQVAHMTKETLERQISSLNHHEILPNSNGHTSRSSAADLNIQLIQVQKTCQELERRRKASSLRRNLGYPVVMLLLLFITSLSVLMVAQNMIELLIGLKALPVGTKEIVLGISSLSALGPFGAAVEITIILYLMLTSLVGLYSLPFFHHLKPRRNDTTMTRIIGNCVVILTLSSALPVLSRILGITNFDLLGNFGRLEWLGNFYIVLSYNLVFAVATIICLTTKFTSSVRTALIDKVIISVQHAFHRLHHSSQTHQPQQHRLSTVARPTIAAAVLTTAGTAHDKTD
jgi:hypothetical protein